MKKQIIGITGCFGSGKTIVATIFKSLGAFVIDADKIAHNLIKPHSASYKNILKVFGEKILGKGKEINRGALGKIVFNNKVKLNKLNKILHPVIIKIIQKQIKVSKNKIIVIDAPLLLESKLNKSINKLVVVKATKKTQEKRLKKRIKGIEKDDISKRIAAQLPLAKKLKQADFIINNNGSVKRTRAQVLKIYRDLKQEGK